MLEPGLELRDDGDCSRGSMASPRTFYEDESFCFAFWNNVAIADVWGDLDARRMRKLGEGYRVLLEQYPKGIVALSLIQKSTPVSSAEARNEGARLLKEVGEQMLHHAMVIEADGVLGLMLRSVVRGLNAVLRGNRMSLHDTVDRALPGLAAQVASDLPRSSVLRELTLAIANVRAAHAPRRSDHASDGRH
jgi:hypothetical protein